MFTNEGTQRIQKELETCYFLSEENEKLLPEKVLQPIAHFFFQKSSALYGYQISKLARTIANNNVAELLHTCNENNGTSDS